MNEWYQRAPAYTNREVVCALNASNTAGKKNKTSLDTRVKLPSLYSPEEALAL